ncbi:hypothetical protein B7G68_15185 [Caulobacter segnis]|uniref:Uncharacterized protein n=2 Tax=Caulobacter segnis TaxID=88688 RepID=A0ABM6TIR1_9CAUL|nr:hypothetical protein B7G68_15185 [Caulobacter segnis]
MVAMLRPREPRYLISPVINKTDEIPGTAMYDRIMAINAQLQSTYGDKFSDYRTWMIQHGLAQAGITPTTQDLTDIANDTIPTSLRADSTHLNDAGYDMKSLFQANEITSRGW